MRNVGKKLGVWLESALHGGDALENFNDAIVSRKIFNWKPLLKAVELEEVNGKGAYKMTIIEKGSIKLDKETAEKFLFGDEKEGGFYNLQAFYEKLDKKLSDILVLPSEDEDEEDSEEDSEEDDEEIDEAVETEEDKNKPTVTDGFTIGLTFTATDFTLTEAVKNKKNLKNKYNAKYITSVRGNVYFWINEESGEEGDVLLGTFEWNPQRYKSDDPKDEKYPKLTDGMKDLWVNGKNGLDGDGFKSDSGAAFLALKNMFRKAATSAKDAFTVVQEESFDMTFAQGITDPVKSDAVQEDEEDDSKNNYDDDSNEDEDENKTNFSDEEDDLDDDGESDDEEIDYEELENKLNAALGVEDMSISFGDSAGDNEYEIKVSKVIKRKGRIGVCNQGGEN